MIKDACGQRLPPFIVFNDAATRGAIGTPKFLRQSCGLASAGETSAAAVALSDSGSMAEVERQHPFYCYSVYPAVLMIGSRARAAISGAR